MTLPRNGEEGLNGVTDSAPAKKPRKGMRRLTGWNIRRRREMWPERGLAITTHGGRLGSTYGEAGADHFREVKVVFVLWTFVLRIDWKVLP